jgi:hypothetical protein
MELSFVCDNSADASFLAQELELALRREGVPANALSLKPSSPENMDIGSILWVSIETATQVLGSVASIASFVKCALEISAKYNTGLTVKNQERTETIPASEISDTRIRAALTQK